MKQHRTTPLATEQIEPHMCSLDVRLKVLSQVPFFEQLSSPQLAGVNQEFREYGYTAGETIYRAGDRAATLYVVASGKVKLMRPAITGQDVLLDMLGPGEFFGTLSSLGDAEYADTAQAQTDCCVLRIEADAFQALLDQYPSITRSVLDVVAQRLRAAHDTIRQLSANSIESRIAAALLKLGDKFGEPTKGGILIQTPLSRQDLADMTGTTTETVSRILTRLRRAKLIKSGRRWVAITNRAQLEELASGGT